MCCWRSSLFIGRLGRWGGRLGGWRLRVSFEVVMSVWRRGWLVLLCVFFWGKGGSV